MLSSPNYIDILFDYPSIDNHAHPLLTEENRDRLAFEGLTSEAEGPALQDSVYTLAHTTARGNLTQLYDLPYHSSWDDVKRHRAALSYDELCRVCFRKAKIQCVLIDDGLGGVKEMGEVYQWHDRYTHSPTRRIVRVEVVAEVRSITTSSSSANYRLFSGDSLGNRCRGRVPVGSNPFEDILREVA